MTNYLINIVSQISQSLLWPLIVGLVLWKLGVRDSSNRVKDEAIRDLMTYRGGDFSSVDFRRALNKVSITFHNDEEIRSSVRDVYEAINNQGLTADAVNRKIVGLIYKLCHKNGFDGITEYDIDQSFPEQKQTPTSISLQPSDLNKAKISNVINKTKIKKQGQKAM